MLCRLFMASLIFVTLNTGASAFVTRIDVWPVNQTTLPGYSTYDVMVRGTDELKGGTGELVGMEMLLELYEGTIYQHSMGSDTPPSFILSQLYPELEFDTYVAAGSSSSAPIIDGGAVNLGGASELTFDESKLDIAWSFPPKYLPNNYFVARITLSEFAYGNLRILGKTAGEPSYLFENSFFPGHGDPSIFSYPGDGSILSLDMAIMNTGGVLADAIELTEGFGGPTMVTSVSLADGTFFAAEDVVGMPINGSNSVGIDVSFIGSARPGFPVGSIVTDELIVETEYGAFRYTLAATVPIPEPGSFYAASFGLIAVMLVRSKQITA